ncbi:MAG: flavodoxin family protein, partial [Muribaculaceae bacterium]|nr:flavodoxin family protein [Muribaculaceae bacterium]
MKYLLASALCLLVSTACSGTNPGNSNENETATQQAPTTSGDKALVVFFSHAGDNYSVGNIEVGNTKIVADYITELTGADQFEIVTHKYD